MLLWPTGIALTASDHDIPSCRLRTLRPESICCPHKQTCLTHPLICMLRMPEEVRRADDDAARP